MKRSKPTVTSAPKPKPPEPSGLAELQRRMAATIMRPLTAGDRMQPIAADGRPAEEDVADFIKPNDRLTSFERLEIYNRQYWFRLLDCLYEDYPGLRAVLGDARFMRLATAYLQRHPSESPLLRNLGARLREFIAAEPIWCGPHLRIAKDMARLEWAQVVAFDAPALPATSFQKLATVPPDKIFFRLQPHITLLDLAYPVDAVVLRLLRKDQKLRSEASNAMESPTPRLRRSIGARIPRKATRLLVHRQENAVYFKPLTRPQFTILHALDRGLSLATACEELQSSRAALEPTDLQTWFQNWAQLKFLVARR